MSGPPWAPPLAAVIAIVLPTLSFADAVSYSERNLELGNQALDNEPSVDRVEEPKAKRETQLFWLHTAPGFQWLRLTAFRAEQSTTIPSADLVKISADGPVLSTGLGLRFRPITLGARGSVGFLSDAAVSPASDLKLLSLNGEIGFWFVPEGRVEPYLILSGGYSKLNGTMAGGKSFEVSGPNARAAFGIDYFASELVSLGVLFSGELLFLTKPGVSASDLLESKQVSTIEEARAQVDQVDGTSVGSAFSLLIGPSLHFD
jgi:hypothetical protein